MTQTTRRHRTDPEHLREEARHLAERLETVALKKEKVLKHLDIEGAKQTRVLIAALRHLERVDSNSELLTRLTGLRKSALVLLDVPLT
jgi:hypothetical protein